MARDNIISFARGFQESFQRAQQIDLQRQREERFDRQLIANADFQQSQLNLQRQQEERLGQQAETARGLRERQFGLAERRVELEERRFGQSEQDSINLNPKLEFLGKASKAGVPTSIVEEIAPLVPDDATAEETPIFFEVAEKLPFFKQEGFAGLTFGLAPGFRKRIKRPNVSKEEVAPKFRGFLQSTNFANRPPSEQATILRSFESSLGIDISGDEPETAVARDQVEFDLQSEFFQDIIKAESGKGQEGNPLQKALDENKITQNEFDSINRGIQAGTITSDQALERIK